MQEGTGLVVQAAGDQRISVIVGAAPDAYRWMLEIYGSLAVSKVLDSLAAVHIQLHQHSCIRRDCLCSDFDCKTAEPVGLKADNGHQHLHGIYTWGWSAEGVGGKMHSCSCFFRER